jgi:hypothetical protein
MSWCEHRHCVHDKHCTLSTNYWGWCPQWGSKDVPCEYRKQARQNAKVSQSTAPNSSSKPLVKRSRGRTNGSR